MNIDDIEIEEEAPNEYRDAGKMFLALLMQSVAHVVAAPNVRVGMAQIRIALGLNSENLQDNAAALGVSPQCLSKGARDFVLNNNLPMPFGLEGEKSSQSHRAAAIKSLAKSNRTKP